MRSEEKVPLWKLKKARSKAHLICLWKRSSARWSGTHVVHRREEDDDESYEWWCSRFKRRVLSVVSSSLFPSFLVRFNWTAQEISPHTRTTRGHHKVKHLMGIMNRPLVTTSVSIIWHHIVINKTWAGFDGKRREQFESEKRTMKKNCFSVKFPPFPPRLKIEFSYWCFTIEG